MELKLQDRLFDFSMWILPIHLGAHWATMVNISQLIIIYPWAPNTAGQTTT
jgi:hypothetical protein